MAATLQHVEPVRIKGATEAAERHFGAILDGEVSDTEVARYLGELATRGERDFELIGCIRALRARMIAIMAPRNAIDVCGMGGDGQQSLNVSTAVALVVAAAGVPVAKHGNRASSSRSGAADTLEALGLDLERAAETAEASLAELNIAFLFTQKHHPALARLSPIRRALGHRTIFNLVGPFCNPARVERHLIGVSHPQLLDLCARVAMNLGSERILLVAGLEPLDELSVSGLSLSVAIEGGRCNRVDIEPEDAGLARHNLSALRGGDPNFNAAALSALLAGERGAYRDAVLLNSAAALRLAGQAPDLIEGARRAADAIDRGAARDLLTRWMRFLA
jgi:anthranilate phosphoribosyltransferase